jgi:hypothetical protein
MKFSNLKYAFLLAFSTFLTLSVSAQKFYVGVQGGYSYATNSGQLGLTNSEESDNTIKIEMIKGGLGQGFNTALTLGYSLSDVVAIELGANYVFNSSEVTDNYSSEFSSGNSTSVIAAQMIQVAPKVVFNLNSESKFNPYLKVGATLGIGKITSTTESTDISNFGSQTFEFSSEDEFEITGGLAFGFNAGIGGNYAINDRISIFSELNLLSMSYAPTKGEVTKYELDGNDELSNLSTSEKETIFVDEIEYDFNGSQNENEPAEQLKMYLPFNNISLNVGLRISL